MTQVCIHEPKTYTLSDSGSIPSFSIKRNLAFLQDAPRLIKTTEHAISNYIWNKDFGAVTWRLESDSPDFGNRKDQINLFKRVFFQASIETPLVIHQKRRGTAEADIVITFQGAKDDRFFKNRPSVLAYAYATHLSGAVDACCATPSRVVRLRPD